MNNLNGIIMQQTIRIFFLFFSLFSLSSYAFDLRPAEIPLQFGGFWSHAGEAQHINIDGLIGDQYTITNHDSSNVLFGAGYYLNGFEWKRADLLYGLNFYYLGKISAQGEIVQENLFTNLLYSYSIQNIPLYAAAKAKIKTNDEKLSVIVDVGIGPNFMQTRQYNEMVLDPMVIPDLLFQGQNRTTFSATAGIGLRLNQFLGQTPIECGYRFFYLGSGQLNPKNEQVLNNLVTGNVYANAIVCSLTI